eukprot:TRINITY_DN6540_c0_g1_i1.p1 TRINITY_DN6540_c0_g1~~TRINITY_DN6540_c0_g1_i1.p1  ORF type:complete len:212 (+),score=50.24 TRINITY_DN6540_c0_g1_i1:307-942(+)
MANVINSSDQITLIAIGPMTNIAALLIKDPSIASKVTLVSMIGSIYKGYNGALQPMVEYNVKMDISAAQKVLSADWISIRLAPLDTAGMIQLTGAKFSKIKKQMDDPLVQSLLNNFLIWAQSRKWIQSDQGLDDLPATSMLFDCEAIYLALPRNHSTLLEIASLPILVDDQGYTIVSENGRKMECAIGWKNLKGFTQLLVERLCTPPLANL